MTFLNQLLLQFLKMGSLQTFAHDITAVMSHAKFCGDRLITILYLNVDHMAEKN